MNVILNAPASALGPSQEEWDCLSSMVQSPWYSLRADDPFEKESESRVRASTLLIYASKMLRIRSIDIPLSGRHEAFRLAVDCQGLSSASAPRSLEICGGENAWLPSFGILPRPKGISLVWSAHEYDSPGTDGGERFAIAVADSLIIEGERRRLLVGQHQLPNWLVVCSDGKEIDSVLSRAERIDRLL